MIRTTILRGLALAAAAAAALAATTGTAAQASPAHQVRNPVVIREIFYNSPGPDHGSNASLNAEWVKLVNRTGQRVTLTNWTLRDTANHVYRFRRYSLRAHGWVLIHTGSGSNNQRNRFQNRGWYVWNNDGDTAILKGPHGNTRSRCSYSDPGENHNRAFC